MEDSGAVEVLGQDVAAPVSQMIGHSKRVTAVRWNPVANGVLASCSVDGKVIAWSTSSQKPIFQYGAKEAVFSVAWNWGGDVLVASDAAKQFVVISRTGEAVPFPGFTGIKASHIVHVEGDVYAGCGFTAQRERQVALFSIKEKKFLHHVNLDSGTGLMTIYFDRNTRILTLFSRGDSLIRMFEITPENKLQGLDAFGDGTCLLLSGAPIPARCVDFNHCEVLRFFAVANYIMPASVSVPRKIVKYDPELFSVGAHVGKAACSQEEWVSGWTGEPLTETVGPRAAVIEAVKAAKEADKGFRRWNEETPANAGAAGASAGSDAVAVAEAPKEPVYDEEEVKRFEGVEYKKVEVVRSSHFRHIFGTGAKPDNCLTGVTPSRSSTDSTLIACSATHLSVALESANGKVLVVAADRVGRLTPGTQDVSIETGSAVVDMQYSRYTSSLLAVAQDSGHVTLWDGLRSAGRLAGHRRRVTSVSWSNISSAILASAALGPNGDVRVFDVEKNASIVSLPNEGVTQLCWSYDDSSLICANRDATIHLYDVRAKATSASASFVSHETGERSLSMCAGMNGANANFLLSAGFAKGSQRQLLLHDLRSPGQSVSQFQMGISNGAMALHWDTDTSVAYVAGKGDSSITMYEVATGQPKIFELTAYRSNAPQTGVAFLPKSVVDVAEVETCRVLKLHADKVEPIKLCVPRQRKDYFQDDIFPDSRDYSKSLATAEQWQNSAYKPNIVTKSMCPANLTPLSTAPPPEKSKKPTSAYFLAKAAEEKGSVDQAEAVKDSLFKKVKAQEAAAAAIKKEQDAAKVGEVADDEW